MSASIEEIYRGYSNEELVEERTSLKEQYDHAYTSQQTGSKAYQKDLNHLTARFQSLTRVMTQRGINPGAGLGETSGVDAGAEFKGRVDMSAPGLDEF